MYCSVVATEEDARRWIELRHTGENEGVGVVPWGAYEVQNFSGTQNTQSRRAAILIDYLINRFPDDASLLASIAQVRDNRLTTLGRLVSDPDVRRALGMEFSGDSVSFAHDEGVVRDSLAHLLDDVAASLSVQKVYTKSLRRTYLDQSREWLPNYGTTSTGSSQESPQGGTEASHDTHGEPSGDTISQGSDAKRRTRSFPRQENHIFQGIQPQIPNLDPGIRNLISDCQRVRIDHSPRICGVLLRVILEMALDDAIDQLKIPNVSMRSPLETKFSKVIRKIEPHIENEQVADPDLRRAWVHSSGQAGGAAIQALHSYVHSLQAPSNAVTVRQYSRLYRPLLIRISQAIGEVQL